MIKNLYRNKYFLVLETFILFILPSVVLTLIPSLFRFYIVLMLFYFPYFLWVIKIQKISKKALGISSFRFGKSAIPLAVQTVLFLLLVFLVFNFLPSIFDQTNIFRSSGILFFWQNKKIPLAVAYLFIYAILTAPIQEFIFRSCLVSRTEITVKNKTFLIFFTAFLYAFAHLSIRSLPIFVGTFVLGLIWGWDFLKNRSLASLSLSHTIIGLFFMLNVILLVS